MTPLCGFCEKEYAYRITDNPLNSQKTTPICESCLDRRSSRVMRFSEGWDK